VSQKIGGGTVSIEAVLRGNELRVVVRDTGVGMKDGGKAALSAGVGLRNVHDRLVHLYGEQYAPRIDSRPGEGTSITVVVPQTEVPPGQSDTVH
jgi:two-component system sensor histidine kinase YesM